MHEKGFPPIGNQCWLILFYFYNRQLLVCTVVLFLVSASEMPAFIKQSPVDFVNITALSVTQLTQKMYRFTSCLPFLIKRISCSNWRLFITSVYFLEIEVAIQLCRSGSPVYSGVRKIVLWSGKVCQVKTKKYSRSLGESVFQLANTKFIMDACRSETGRHEFTGSNRSS